MSTEGDAGFSLLDALIGLAISGLLGVAAVTSIEFVQRTSVRASSASERMTAVAEADRLFSGLIERMAISTVDQVQPSFFGSPASMTLVSSGPDALLLDRVSPIRIDPATTEKGLSLTLSWSPSTEKRRAVLLRGASSAGFAYFGSASKGAPEEWLAGWSRNDALPRAIKVNVQLKDRLEPVELVYRLRPQPLKFCLSDACRREGST
jgi:hypothetical protein